MTTGPIKNAAQALRYWELRNQTAANNLANAGTTGFKAERVFGQVQPDGRLVPLTQTDFSGGSLTQTGATFDVALGGDGFLLVKTGEGERMVRGGSFSLDPRGRLIDARGDAVVGEQGDIFIPPGEVEIDRSGQVKVDGEPVDRLRVVTVGDPQALQHAGEARFAAPDEALRDLAPELRQVHQGHLEESNMNPLQGMIETITIQRAYGSVERAIGELDATLRTIANEIARPV